MNYDQTVINNYIKNVTTEELLEILHKKEREKRLEKVTDMVDIVEETWYN